jgi:hypothetical protein
MLLYERGPMTSIKYILVNVIETLLRLLPVLAEQYIHAGPDSAYRR